SGGSTAPAPTPASTGTAYHVEETSSAVQFSGYWYENKSAANSGASAKLSMSAGASMTFTFVGRALSLTGYRDAYCGMARITVDGTPTDVDMYAGTGQYKATLFSNTDL